MRREIRNDDKGRNHRRDDQDIRQDDGSVAEEGADGDKAVFEQNGIGERFVQRQITGDESEGDKAQRACCDKRANSSPAGIPMTEATENAPMTLPMARPRCAGGI